MWIFPKRYVTFNSFVRACVDRTCVTLARTRSGATQVALKKTEIRKGVIDGIVPSDSIRAADRNIVPLIQALNAKPLLAIFGIFIVVFLPASYVLDQYVAEAKHSLVMFAAGSYMVWSSYFSFHYHLKRYSSSYRRIPLDKQFYVLSNFIKSALLLSYSPLAVNLLYEVIVLDKWNVTRIWNLGCT